jgi:hypothetical protein
LKLVKLKGSFDGKIKERTLHGVSGAVGSLFCKEFATYGAMCRQSAHIAIFAKLAVLLCIAAHCEPFDEGVRQ